MSAASFVVPERLELPRNVVRFSVGGEALLVAPDIGAALLVDPLGEALFSAMAEGSSPRQALEAVVLEQPEQAAQVLVSFKKLLAQIELEQFHHQTQPVHEDPRAGEQVVHVYLTHACNLTCVHCYMSAGKPLPREMNLEQFKAVLSKLAPRADLITLSGGEPMGVPFFFELAEWLRGEFGVALNLITNATYVDTPEKAARLASLFREVQVSIDGATEAVFERARGPGSFAPAIRGLRLLAEQTFPELAVAICLLPWNVEDVCRHLVGLLEEVDPERRIHNVRLSDTNQYGRADASMVTRLSPEEEGLIVEMQRRLAATGRKNWTKNDDARNDQYFRFGKGATRFLKGSCGFGEGLIVDSNGDVYPCPMMKKGERLANFFEADFHDKLAPRLESAFQRHHVDQMTPCKSCEVRYICRGGCRVANASVSGSTTKVACDERYKLVQLHRIAGQIRNRYSPQIQSALRVLQG